MVYIRVNGVLYNVSTFSNMLLTSTSTSIIAGAGAGFSNGFSGYIFETALYRYALTDQQIQKIERGLAWKWGLQNRFPTPLTFNPNNLATGLTLWLDASDKTTLFQDTAGTIPVTTSGQSIAYWKDKTGFNSYIQATSGSRPTYSPNGVLFNGSQFLQTLVGTGLPSGAANGTYIFVTVPTDGSTSKYIENFYSIGGMNYGFLSPTTNNRAYYCGNSQGGGGTVDGVNFWNQPSICVIQLTGATSVSSGAWENSVGFNAQASQPYNLALTSTSVTNVGSGSSGYNYPFVGLILEILVYTTTITTSQRQQVEGYLAQKWGIQSSLPTSQPYRNTGESTNTFVKVQP